MTLTCRAQVMTQAGWYVAYRPAHRRRGGRSANQYCGTICIDNYILMYIIMMKKDAYIILSAQAGSFL